MNSSLPCFLTPDWPAPACVHALITTRNGGCSTGAYRGHQAGAHEDAGGFNLGSRCGDAPDRVAANRALLRTHLPSDVRWLHQVHGTTVIDAALGKNEDAEPPADAVFTTQAKLVCAVQMADCMPVLFCNDEGNIVAAAHAGWRGLAAGVLEATVHAMHVDGHHLMAYLGPAIGPQAFEVGTEVRNAFVDADTAAATCFMPHQNKWLCNLEGLARQRLGRLGIERVYGGGRCTYSEPEFFYSYRREQITGRMAALIWFDAAEESI